ncbi:MAG: hypothetical protein ACRDYY_05615 [Acidimicrobiales bacterium]
MEALSGPERRVWLAAMLAEQAVIVERRSARRFARGCVRAVLWSPPTLDREAGPMAGSIAAAATGAAGLGVYGLVAYPEVRSGWIWLIYLVVFAVLVASCGVFGVQCAQLGFTWVRRLGVAAGLPGAVVGWWAAQSNTVVSMVEFVVVVPPLLAAVYVAKHSHRTAQVAVVAGEAAVVAGLSTFIGFVVTAYATGGGDRSPTTLGQFAASGAHDYASWAISGELGGAVFLLVAVPIVTLIVAGTVTTAMGWARARL